MVKILVDTPGNLGQEPAMSIKLEDDAALNSLAVEAYRIARATTRETHDQAQVAFVVVDIRGWLLARRPLTQEKTRRYLDRYRKVEASTLEKWRSEQAKSGTVGNSPALTMSALVFQDFLWNEGDWKKGQPQTALRRFSSLTKDAVTRWDAVAMAGGSDVYGSWTLLGVDELFVEDVFQQQLFDAAMPVVEKLLAAAAPVSTDGYGLSPEKPIRVGAKPMDVQAEHRFLASLRGPAGQPVAYRRLGSCCRFETPHSSLGAGLLDKYEVTYAGLPKSIELYLDMYTPGVPLAPAGFVISK
jgi:hypothetical protein